MIEIGYLLIHPDFSVPPNVVLHYRTAIAVNASGALCPGPWSEWKPVQDDISSSINRGVNSCLADAPNAELPSASTGPASSNTPALLPGLLEALQAQTATNLQLANAISMLAQAIMEQNEVDDEDAGTGTYMDGSPRNGG